MAAHFPPYDKVDKPTATEYNYSEDVDKRPRKDSDELHRRIPDAFDERRIDIVAQNGNEGEHYKALDKQVGGTHYKTLGIQPLEHTYITYGYIGLKAAIHTKVDKYLKRNKENEVQDIQKAIHCLEILLDKAKEEQK